MGNMVTVMMGWIRNMSWFEENGRREEEENKRKCYKTFSKQYIFNIQIDCEPDTKRKKESFLLLFFL